MGPTICERNGSDDSTLASASEGPLPATRLLDGSRMSEETDLLSSRRAGEPRTAGEPRDSGWLSVVSRAIPDNPRSGFEVALRARGLFPLLPAPAFLLLPDLRRPAGGMVPSVRYTSWLSTMPGLAKFSRLRTRRGGLLDEASLGSTSQARSMSSASSSDAGSCESAASIDVVSRASRPREKPPPFGSAGGGAELLPPPPPGVSWNLARGTATQSTDS